MKMFRFQAVILYLCLCAPNAMGQSNQGVDQSSATFSSQPPRQLMVRWDSGNFIPSQAWASSLMSKYQGKIGQVALVPSSNQAVFVQFQAGRIREEDLLQVLELEGMPSPYYINNGVKYHLGLDKALINEPIK